MAFGIEEVCSIKIRRVEAAVKGGALAVQHASTLPTLFSLRRLPPGTYFSHAFFQRTGTKTVGCKHGLGAIHAGPVGSERAVHHPCLVRAAHSFKLATVTPGSALDASSNRLHCDAEAPN